MVSKSVEDRVLTLLRNAIRGLLYPSETDAPFEPFVWEAAENSAASVTRFAKEAARNPCRSLSLDEFLNVLNQEKPFQVLRATLENALEGIVVYRYGSVEPTYYLVGKDSSGRLAGLKTSAVET